MTPGTVALVGAGPGDPELLTIRGLRLLEQADVVIHDRLGTEQLLQFVRGDCELVDAGKVPGRHGMTQEQISDALIQYARLGKRVVRLKGGDPFVFGRGGEEALALAMAGIACEVVPGVTTAVAAPELAGIPVTHRGIASGFLVLAGHTSDAVDNTLQSVRPNSVSIVMLMSMGARGDLASRLMAHGWSADTPAAIVPTPLTETSFTLISASGLAFFRSWMSWAKSSIE